MRIYDTHTHTAYGEMPILAYPLSYSGNDIRSILRLFFFALSRSLARPQPPQTPRNLHLLNERREMAVTRFGTLHYSKCACIVNIQMYIVCVHVCVYLSIFRVFSCLFFSGFLLYIVIQICELHSSQTTREMNTDKCGIRK